MSKTKRKFCYDYPRPAVTVDVVVFAMVEGRLSVLLIRRAHGPFKDCWAIPGGFVDMDEPLEVAAARELAEETGVADVPLEQFAAFGDPGRDPRGRTISIAYLAMLSGPPPVHRAGDDAAEANWLPIDDLPELAFDHELILRTAIQRVGPRAEARG